MKRRGFLTKSAALSAGFAVGFDALKAAFPFKDLIIGHNSHRYKLDMNWGALNAKFYPVNDCHEMVQDAKGRILLLTNHTKNNVIIYDKSGRLVDVWGTDYPGAHGFTLHNQGGEDFLYITDTSRNEVIKTDINGKVVMTLPYPKETGKYAEKGQYQPTETAIAPNGDIYVADGYGKQFITHYNAKGAILNTFGGKGEGDEHFDNAHGICIDDRVPENPVLLITARMQNKLKRFTLDGKYIDSIHYPGAYICRPVIHKENVYLATIWSGDDRAENSGFISILNKENQLVSAPGGIEPIYKSGELNKMEQEFSIFQHPHDVCVDEEDNIYVAQWNSGKTYPIKLIRQ